MRQKQRTAALHAASSRGHHRCSSSVALLCGIFGSVIPGLRTFLIVVSSSVRLQLREIQHFLQALVPTQSHQGFNIKSQTGSFLNNISTFFTRLGSNTISSKFELQKTDWLCPKQNFRLRFWVFFYLRLES